MIQNLLKRVKETELQERGGRAREPWSSVTVQCSDDLCIMNEAVIMIAVHLQTEKSPVAELQATRPETSWGGTAAGEEQCRVNITQEGEKK